MLDGLGTPDAQSADLMSYLLFDAAYTRTVVDLGYRDAGQRIAEIEALVAASGALDRVTRRKPAADAKRPRRSRRQSTTLRLA